MIWHELDNFLLTLCVSVQSSVLAIIAQRKSEDEVVHFLNGLNKQYYNVKSHVVLIDLIPTIAITLSYVSQQEKQFSK